MRLSSVCVPGKVMLTGEYAVLQGGTAVLVPVPRHLTISESAQGRPRRHSPVIESSLTYLVEETSAYEKDFGLPEVSVDHSEFFSVDREGTTQKLGLGLSAAEAVGVIALRFERAGLCWADYRENIAKYGQNIHSEVQGGIGSGADVALCAYREPIRFRRDQASVSVAPMSDRKISTLLHLAWTGFPADTRQMVAGFHSWLSMGGSRTDALLADLVESSHRTADTWFASSANELFDSLDRFCGVLEECMNDAHIAYMLPIHRRLADWARDRGGRAKPAGAGGGDMILLIGDLPVDELDMMIIPVNV